MTNEKQASSSQIGEQEWLVKLFRKSVLKQRKFKEVVDRLGPTDGLDCLDIGSDNGVISYLLRRRGGHWTSADLNEQAVEAIRRMVQTNVYQLDGGRTPFADEEFDRIAILDFLEHIPDDAGFLQEIYRILKPGGILIINVPHRKESLLRKLRYSIGQTDEKHGHLRPGYTRQDLQRLLGDRFVIENGDTYSRFFSELIDTLIVFAVSLLQRTPKEQSTKGLLVTGDDLKKNKTMFRLYSIIYPLVWLCSKLDHLLLFSSGYMLILKARAKKQPVEVRQEGQIPVFGTAVYSTNGGHGKSKANGRA